MILTGGRNMKPIEKAIKALGSQQALADALGVTQGAISQWLQRESVPAARCRQIEEATAGVVTRYELRPDVFGSTAA